LFVGKGGKNRRRGKNENEDEKRELVFKEDGQGELLCRVTIMHLIGEFGMVFGSCCIGLNYL